MRKEDNHIDELFRSKLDDFEIKPPAYVWDAILEKQEADKRKKRALWIKFSGVAAALLLAFLLGWELQHEGELPATNEMAAKQIGKDNFNGEDEIDSNNEKDVESQLAESSRTIGDSKNTNDKDLLVNESSVVKQKNSEQQRSSEASNLTVLENAEVERSESILAMLQKRLSEIAFIYPKTNELDEIDPSEDDAFLSEQDRAIIAQNQQTLQSEKKKKRSGLGWAVGAQVNPVLAVNDSKQSQQYASGMNKATENSSMQLGGGLTVAVKRSGRWSIQSGVMYNTLSQSSSNNVSNRNSNLDYAAAPETSGIPGSGAAYYKVGESSNGTVSIQTPAGTIQVNSLPQNALVAADYEALASSSSDVLMTSTDFEQHFDYIEIPLLLRYQLVDQKFGLQLMAGLNTGFLVGNSAYADSGSGRSNIGETSDMNSVSYSTNFGVGLGYKLTPALQLRFEPQMRYYLESLSSNPDISYKPYTFGFYTGISYSF
ncbi:outer membrane beta-barrel protein [Mangrovibacterium diazotrophicum]|uniref:Outer membrane protein with beta-barrel domain n=1 Tax=Mangrovibacterium diazotrophicum TaxID=1261403 RepID=A0A419VV85_9BACT|nr:outer membrane beta-barrel protein [Mangrovibacterium diazotrophicum]RKD86043.1 outer membrane protein with beta-barrel domain [Mangrovibacterium diazotrophicum]